MVNKNYDFGGWLTKYNIQCSDGRTILPGAFKEANGKRVSLVYNHEHGMYDIVGHLYEATCDRCGCKFEFEDEDVTQRTRNFGIANTLWVDCPFCSKELKIYSPTVVREKLIDTDEKVDI